MNSLVSITPYRLGLFPLAVKTYGDDPQNPLGLNPTLQIRSIPTKFIIKNKIILN